jgi:hypothetical protein
MAWINKSTLNQAIDYQPLVCGHKAFAFRRYYGKQESTGISPTQVGDMRLYLIWEG